MSVRFAPVLSQPPGTLALIKPYLFILDPNKHVAYERLLFKRVLATRDYARHVPYSVWSNMQIRGYTETVIHPLRHLEMVNAQPISLSPFILLLESKEVAFWRSLGRTWQNRLDSGFPDCWLFLLLLAPYSLAVRGRPTKSVRTLSVPFMYHAPSPSQLHLCEVLGNSFPSRSQM